MGLGLQWWRRLASGLIGLAIGVLPVLPVQADTWISGRIAVVDGDTIRIDGQSVRLHGIDAPETEQRCGGIGEPVWPCGRWVTETVRARYDGRHGRCAVQDTDRYGRAVARCFVGNADIGQRLVQDGLAFAYLRYSTEYRADEARAERAGAGLHDTRTLKPEDFRAMGREIRAQAFAPPGDCPIKGNISGNGRIYHLPGQAHYEKTRISTARGERWFCTEAAALDAGWRKALR